MGNGHTNVANSNAISNRTNSNARLVLLRSALDLPLRRDVAGIVLQYLQFSKLNSKLLAKADIAEVDLHDMLPDHLSGNPRLLWASSPDYNPLATVCSVAYRITKCYTLMLGA
jgi:hypothetical protein